MTASNVARNLLAGAGVASALLLLGFGVGSSKAMPRNALILLDHQDRTYLAPVCVPNASRYEEAVAARADELGYRPEPECREKGAFVQDGRSLSGLALQRLGLLGPLRSRWNGDGTWNW